MYCLAVSQGDSAQTDDDIRLLQIKWLWVLTGSLFLITAQHICNCSTNTKRILQKRLVHGMVRLIVVPSASTTITDLNALFFLEFSYTLLCEFSYKGTNLWRTLIRSGNTLTSNLLGEPHVSKSDRLLMYHRRSFELLSYLEKTLARHNQVK